MGFNVNIKGRKLKDFLAGANWRKPTGGGQLAAYFRQLEETNRDLLEENQALKKRVVE